MVGLVKYFKRPVFISSLVCVCLFYSGIVKTKEDFFYISLIPQNNVSFISCKLINSPVKNSKGNYYVGKSDLMLTISEDNSKSSARGRIQIYIPCDMAEAYFPGKLYSSTKDKKQTLYEAGGNYLLKGKFNSNRFYVSDCITATWQKNIFGKIDYFRALCRLQFKRLMFGWGEAGGLLLALLCGSKEYTDLTTADNFRRAGLSHILALSGMHLSMFSSIAMFLGKKIKRKKISFIIRIVALFLFVWFAGFSPSLLRAYICAMLTLFASIIGTEKPDMLMILCFSFLLQCIISPSDIHNMGFILSYSALAGILIFNRLFNILYIRFLPYFLANSLSASTSAQIFTMPISLKLFGSFSPIGIVATTVISPLVTLFIYSGLFLIILCLLIPGISGYSAIFINFLYNIIKYGVSIFSKVPNWSLN